MAAGRSDDDDAPLSLARRADHLGAFFPREALPPLDPREESSVAARADALRAETEAIVARQRDCGLTVVGDGGFAGDGLDPSVDGLVRADAGWRLRDVPKPRPPLCAAFEHAKTFAGGAPTRASIDHAATLLDLADGAVGLDDPERVFADEDARAIGFAAILRSAIAEATVRDAATLHLDLGDADGPRRLEIAAQAFREPPEPDDGPTIARSIGLRAAPDDVDRLAAALERLDVEAIHFSRAALDDATLDALSAWPADKAIGLGLLDASTRLLDPPDKALRTLDKIGERLDLDRCFLAHGGGFRARGFGEIDGLRYDDQWRKLDHLVSLARRVWPD